MTTQVDNLPEIIVAFFNRAAHDEVLSERMSFADTVVQMHFTDLAEPNSCTVRLDRTPIEAEIGAVGQAEIEMFAPTPVWLSLFVGDAGGTGDGEQLAMSIVHGDVTYTGPVRKFLRVVPILSTFDFEVLKTSLSATGDRAQPAAPGRDGIGQGGPGPR